MLLGVASLQLKNNEGLSISSTPYGFKKPKMVSDKHAKLEALNRT